jgi:hypothetical protein
MLFFRELGVFLWAVLTNWAGYATGGVVVGLAWLWSTLSQVPLSRKFGILLAAVFLFLAVFNAWRDQRERVTSKEAEIARLTDQLDALRVPSFEIEALNGILGGRPDGSQVALVIRLVSKGAPAAVIASSWKMIVTADGRLWDGIPQTMTEGSNFDFCFPPRTVWRFVREDAIYLKASQSMERNNYQEGVLIFVFVGLKHDILVQSSTCFTVEADAVSGHKISFSTTVADMSAHPSQVFISSLKHPVPLDIPCRENEPIK